MCSVPATITGAPDGLEVKTLPRHKKNPDVGTKQTTYSSSIFIEQEDALSFEPNEEITLMDWGNAIVRKKVVEGDKVTSLELELHLAGDVKKTKLKVGGSLWFFLLSEAIFCSGAHSSRGPHTLRPAHYRNALFSEHARLNTFANFLLRPPGSLLTPPTRSPPRLAPTPRSHPCRSPCSTTTISSRRRSWRRGMM